MKALEKQIHSLIKEKGKLDFPGGKVQAFYKGKKIVDIKYGKTWKIYDIASLTKILFTTTVYMKQVKNRTVDVYKTVSEYLPWYPHRSVRVSQLLNHTAGNIWWFPFYKRIDLKMKREDRYCDLQRSIREHPRSHSRQAEYSDVDFFLLGALLERVLARPLLNIWQDYCEHDLSTTDLHFNVLNKPLHKKSLYAPTEKCKWRKKTLQGEVHDENAWSLGGVAPHAGLFGTIDDISYWALQIRKAHRGEKSMVDSSVVKMFTVASMPQSQGFWGLGFMKPSENSTAGKYFSMDSFGHTGFTGMSLWMDPRRDLVVTLCSNRVHPTRKNKDFIELRPRIHDVICEYLKENGS